MLPRFHLVLLPVACCMACGAESNTAETALTSQGEANEAVCLTSGPKTQGNSGSPLWLRSYDTSLATSIASDTRGNALLARSGLETLKLDSEGRVLWAKPFGALVASDRDDNVWVVDALAAIKLDAAGRVLLTTRLAVSAAAGSLAVDSTGNVAISGPGLGTVKLDALGRLLWSKPFFGALAFDTTGNLVLTGALSGASDFGAGPLESRGGSDVFVAKLSASGEHLFSRSFGDQAEQQRGEAITVDAQGNLLLAGVFDGTLDFEAGSPLAPAACPADAWCKTSGFAAKLDSEGRVLWSQALGPMRTVDGAASDALGNVVLSGALPGGVTPFRNAWLAAFDASGTPLWRRAEWPETGIGAGHGVAIDPCNNVFWSVSALPNLESEERAYVAKLSH